MNEVTQAPKRLAVATGSALAVLTGAASATPAAFDSASVVTLIEGYGAQAVLIVGAFILAVWGLKAMGLFKRG